MKSVVLLHGLGTGSEAWQPQVSYFGDRYRVVTPDLPGFGGTDGEFTFESAIAHFSKDLIESGAQKVVLCGLTLGALVALKYSLAKPTQVEGLVLVAGFATLPAAVRRQQSAMISELEGLPLETMATVIEQLTSNVPDDVRADAKEALRSFTPITLAALFKVVSGYDVTSECADFSRPTLVARGSEDAPNVSLSQDLARKIPTATTHVINNAGHVANLDAPAEFNAMLDEFISFYGTNETR